MVRDFDFLPSPQNSRPAIPQPAPISRPINDYQVPIKPKPVIPKRPIPPENTLDLRPQTQESKLDAQHSHTTLRNYYPIKQTRPIVRQPARQPQQHEVQRTHSEPSLPILQPTPTPAAEPTSQNIKSKYLNWRTILGAVLSTIAIALLMTGFATPLLQNPHIVVAMYIPIAIIFKLKSQTSFSIALLLLIAIPILIVLKQEALAETYAVFTFYFLVVGVVMAAFELRSSPRRAR